MYSFWCVSVAQRYSKYERISGMRIRTTAARQMCVASHTALLSFTRNQGAFVRTMLSIPSEILDNVRAFRACGPIIYHAISA